MTRMMDLMLLIAEVVPDYYGCATTRKSEEKAKRYSLLATPTVWNEGPKVVPK